MPILKPVAERTFNFTFYRGVSRYKISRQYQFYEKKRLLYIGGMYLSGNLVNSLSDYLDTSKEFIKAYPIDKIADVQTGYILKRNQGYTDISKYYLFKDGTGFELEVSVDQLEKVKDPKDYSSFVKHTQKKLLL